MWTRADALERGLIDELGDSSPAVRRAKVLAGLDADTEVRLAGCLPGSSMRDVLRARASSQPAAASLPAAAAGLMGSALGDMLERGERAVSGVNAVWLGDWRF